MSAAHVNALRGVVRIASAASCGVTGNVPRIAAAEQAIAAATEAFAAMERIETVLAEFEGMTGAGYRYMAAEVRKAMEGKQ